MSLTLGLTAAVSGLQTAQKGLDLVSHNIANVNTEGFTRKIFNAESVVLAGRGAGVQTGAITRQVDQNLLKDLQKETGINARLLTLDDYYSRMQDMWGEPGSNNSISHIVASLGAEFESLAVSPNASTEQATVVDSAVRMLDKLNLMTDEIQSLRLQADKELEAYATQINTRLTNISNLNDKIVYSMATAQTGTTDLQDKRDLELLKLSELMDVQAFERDNGSIVVFSNGGSTLVDSTANTVSHTSLTLVNPWLSHAGGDFGDISVANLDVTNDFGRGRARGLVELRDSILPDLQAEIDQLTTTMMEQVNQVHNRGTPFPEMVTAYTGSRDFLTTTGATQTMTLTSGDTKISLVDTTGAQAFTTTLNTIMQSALYGSGAQASNGPWTIQEVALKLNDWLAANVTGSTADIDANGNMAINVNSSSYSLHFHDESATAANSTSGDVTIGFDADGDGTSDETASGFANFFGLNDFFTSSRGGWVWDSTIMSSTATVGTAGTLNFSDKTNGFIYGTMAVSSTDTLSTIADNINADATLSAQVQAEVVPEGSGYRLRIRRSNGEEMAITQSGGTALITALGLGRADVGQAKYVSVRSDIIANPQLVSRGAMQYSTDKSEYYVSAGDNQTANDIADLFTNKVSFTLAGDLSAATRTFENYADSILSLNSSQASSLQTELDYQNGLTERLTLKQGEISAVNLDEELSQLMIYEQSYAAAGKVISTIDKMLEILNSLIR